MKTKVLPLVIILATAMLIVSCVAPSSGQSARSQGGYRLFGAIKPAVIVKSGYYVDPHPVSLKKAPAWLQRSVTLTAHKMPLSILMSRLLRNTNINVNYNNAVRSYRLVSLDYSGSLQGALRNISAKTNYYYTTSKDNLDWSAFETKTFNVSFMAEQGHRRWHKKSSNRVSAWHDLDNVLNQMKSKHGHVILSKSTDTVTVKDHPSNVHNMAAYIKRLPTILRNQG